VVALAAACSQRPSLGVVTTTVAPSGRCDTSRVVVVGATLPLSGRAARLAHEYLTGLELGVDHVNAAGGVLDTNRCLELVYKNDRGDLQRASRAVTDLVNTEGVVFLVGPALPAQVRAAGAGLARAGVPTSGWTGLDSTHRPARYPWMFPVSSSDATVAATMAADASSQGWTRVGLVTAVPSGPGAAAFTAAARRHGITVVGRVAGPGTIQRGLAQLRQVGPQALIVLDDDPPSLASVLAARARLGWTVPVVTTATATDATVLDRIGATARAGVRAVVPQALVLQPGVSTAAVRGFRDAVRRSLHTAHVRGSVLTYAQAYDAVSMLGATVTSVRSTSPTSLRTFLESAGYVGLLASYQYSSGSRTGIPGDQLSVVPLSALADGLFVSPDQSG
jgi:ABC-type branched-subunit amino acid transport system substrate-binding protein